MATVMRALAAGALALAGACGDGGTSPIDGFAGGTVLESEHFRLHLYPGDTSACDESLVELEAHFAALRATLAFPWSAPPKIDYWKFPDDAAIDAARPCPVSRACARGTEVFASVPLHEHELIHAYLAPYGQPPSAIGEGLAEALSCAQDVWTADERQAFEALAASDLAGWNAETERDARFYDGATQLVRSLIHDEGVAGFMAGYRDLAAGGVKASLDPVFAARFGVSLATAWETARALDLPSGPCLAPYACAAAPLAAGETMTVGARCGVAREHRSLTSPSAVGRAAAVIRKSGAALFRLRACDDGNRPLRPRLAVSQGVFVAPLAAAGHYALEAVAGAGGTTEIALAAAPGGAYTTSCDQAVAAPLDLGAEPFELVVPRDEPPAFAGLRFASPWSAGHWAAGAPASALLLCGACADPDASCLPLAPEYSPDTSAPLSGAYLLRLPALPPSSTLDPAAILWPGL